MAARRWGRRLAQASGQAIDLTSGPSAPDAAPAALAPPTKQPRVSEVSETCGQPSGPPPGVWTASAAQAPGPRRPAASRAKGAAGSGATPEQLAVPIAPQVSLAFAAEALAGRKASTHPVRRAQGGSFYGGAGAGAGSAAGSAAGPTEGGTLVWLRPFDLRIHDHAALVHASKRPGPVHIVFAWSEAEDAEEGPWAIAGTAMAPWLHKALESLDADLRARYGVGVAYRAGATTAAALLEALAECGASEVVTSRAYDPAGAKAEKDVQLALADWGVALRRFNTFLLYDIEEVRVDLSVYRGHFGTLTPFHAAESAKGTPPQPLPEPRALQAPRRALASHGLDALGFARLPLRQDGGKKDWAASILAAWEISEAAALAALQLFLAAGGGFGRYEKQRNLADASGVARISPYLRFGMLSCRRMYHEVRASGGKNVSITFWRRLTWRDLAYWQLLLFPQMQEVPIRKHYMGQAWSDDRRALDLWQRGRTGYPLVDAGMRELWATGWMAQNVRMVAAVLLCEILHIHWVEGEKWFYHTLVDADPAINAMMWQNAGKGGLDQWNFTMHPAKAGRGQDPDGVYVRRWCPELAGLPTKHLHSPWEAPEQVLRAAGVRLGPGGTYPARVAADVAERCRQSADAIRAQRARAPEWNDGGGYDLITLPRGATVKHDGQRFRIFTKREFRDTAAGGARSEGGGGGAQRRSGAGGGGGGGGAGVPQWRRQGPTPQFPPRTGPKFSGASGGTSHQSVLDEYMQKAVGA